MPVTNEENREPGENPVKMPELPATLRVNTAQQFKAIGDHTRWHILDMIQHRPATAKQIADSINVSPGTVGHHLQVLEAAGLAQVVARRIVHGIVAKYYTRTARTFIFDFPPEMKGDASINLDIMTSARNYLAESLAEGEHEIRPCIGFPRVRLSPARARAFMERVQALVDDFMHEPADPEGQIYSLCAAFFQAPSSQQGLGISEEDTTGIR